MLLHNKPFEDGELYVFSHDTSIPCHEWGGEVGFSSHIERNSISSDSINGLVIKYLELTFNVPDTSLGPDICSIYDFKTDGLILESFPCENIITYLSKINLSK